MEEGQSQATQTSTGAAQAAPPKPSVGRIVRYVMPNGDECAGMITRVHSDRVVNLRLFPDEGQYRYVDREHEQRDMPTSVTYDESKAGRTWHWPERV